jgi:arsenate reductase (glutaredoxin)
MSDVQVQLFGLRKSAATRAAERYFKERKVKVIFVDLAARPLARGELNRFLQGRTPNDLLDLSGKAYEQAGLAYLRVSDEGLIAKLLDNPALLRLPLVRGGKRVTVGDDPAGWAALLGT